MRVRLSDVKEQPFSWSETRQLDAASLDDPRLADLGAIGWSGELSYVAPELLLRARADYPRRLVCDRCLEQFEDEVHEDIELLVDQAPKGEAGEHELGRSDLDVLEVEGDEVDLEALLAEQVVLAIPHRPLCGRPDCAVPVVGDQVGAGDPRWAALASIREGLDPDQS
jgi:uncharacterized protein